MSFTLLDGSWVAHPARFTVQCVDRYRVVYADAEALMTLDTDIAERRLTVSREWMSVIGTRQASDLRLRQIATRTVFALAAMGLAADVEPSLVSETEGPDLLVDLAGLDVAEVLGLAAAVRAGASWEGRFALLEPGQDGGFRWHAAEPLPQEFDWRLDPDQAEAVVGAAVAGLFAAVPGTSGFRLADPVDSGPPEWIRVQPRDGSYLASFAPAAGPEPGVLDAMIVGSGSALSGQVLVEAVPGLLLAGLGLAVDEGGWSHRVEFASDPGSGEALAGTRTVADFLDVWGVVAFQAKTAAGSPAGS